MSLTRPCFTGIATEFAFREANMAVCINIHLSFVHCQTLWCQIPPRLASSHRLKIECGEMLLTGDGAVGISWSQRYTYCQAQTPPPSQEGSLGYYTTDCVAPLPHLYIFASVQVFF